MTVDPLFCAVALPAVFLLGLSKGGFAGVGLLATPLMALVMPPLEAAVILLPIAMAQDVVSVITYRRNFDGRILLVLLAGAVAGVAFGAVLASRVSNALIELIVGAIAIGFVLHTCSRRLTIASDTQREPALASGVFWGLCAGFTSFIANAGAPPFQIYLLPKKLSPVVYAGTGTMFFAAVNIAKFCAFGVLGQMNAAHLQMSALLAPPAIASTFAGIWLVRRAQSERFYGVVYALTLAIGLYLVGIGGHALIAA